MPDGDHTFDPRGRHDGKTPVDTIPPVVHIQYGHRKKPGPKPKAGVSSGERIEVPAAGLAAIEEKSKLTWVEQAEEIRALVSVQLAYLRGRRSDHLEPDDLYQLRVCAQIVKSMSSEQRQAGGGDGDPTDTEDEEKLEEIAEGR